MLKRSIALIVCFSLVGVTAAPGFALPCCCKNLSKPAVAEKASACCKSEHSLDTASHSEKARSCCATASRHEAPPALSDLGSGHSCCSGNTIRKDCPMCRCLEQMQIVALSGTVAPETSIRNSVGVPLVSAALSLSEIARVPATVADLECRGAPIGLRTCSLRC
jgi:hypothetical protein